MYPLFETICWKDGMLVNPDLHLERIHRAQKDYLKMTTLMKESVFLDITLSAAERSIFAESILKIRFFYGFEAGTAETAVYERRKLSSLKAVRSDSIEYSFKFADRRSVDSLFRQRGTADDIIIIKNGFITDSSFGNLLFENEDGLFTPDTPLLKGTMREYLLRTGMIAEESITLNDLHRYSTVHNINAMNGPGDQSLPVKSILTDHFS